MEGTAGGRILSNAILSRMGREEADFVHGEFKKICQAFEREVWNKGMGAAVDSGKILTKPLRFEWAEVEIDEYFGNYRVTFSGRKGETFVLQVFTNSSPGSIEVVGPKGSISEFRVLVNTVISGWPAAAEQLR